MRHQVVLYFFFSTVIRLTRGISFKKYFFVFYYMLRGSPGAGSDWMEAAQEVIRLVFFSSIFWNASGGNS